MASIAGSDRTHAVLVPDVRDDSVGPAHPVRCLDAFVAQLDWGALGVQRAVPAETGRPGDDPGDRLRLSLSGSLHRLRSSRRLEPERHRTVDLLWLRRRLRPDFTTIADFRRDHPAALTGGAGSSSSWASASTCVAARCWPSTAARSGRCMRGTGAPPPRAWRS